MKEWYIKRKRVKSDRERERERKTITERKSVIEREREREREKCLYVGERERKSVCIISKVNISYRKKNIIKFWLSLKFSF